MTVPLREKLHIFFNDRRFHYKYVAIALSCMSAIDLRQQFSDCSFQMNTTSILLRVGYNKNRLVKGLGQGGPPTSKIVIRSYTY